MVNLTLALEVGLGVPILAFHMLSVALAKALRTYSRSRLEDVCAAHGRGQRADEIAHHDEAAERSAEALAVLTGLCLAALLGALAAQVAPQLAVEAVVGIALAIGALGHVAAGVVGRVHAERLLDALWPVARILRRLMVPLTAASRSVEAMAYRLARRSATAPRPASVEVEIHSLESPEQDMEAELPESVREILERVVELGRRDVSNLMIPRSAIVALPTSVTAAEAARAFRESGHSRIPLYGENRDDIVGILHVKDLLAAMADPSSPQPPSPRKLARPAYCVPETKNADELLEEFRARRTHQAIVLDEYGGVAGLITLEDLVEYMLGRIDDEHDVPPPAEPIIAIGEAQFDVDGGVPLEELNERLGLHLPTNGDIQTVGGFAFNALGRLPQPGESFRHEGIDFTVTEVAEHTIRRLRLDLHPNSETVGSGP